jgi:hypothetical protein
MRFILLSLFILPAKKLIRSRQQVILVKVSKIILIIFEILARILSYITIEKTILGEFFTVSRFRLRVLTRGNIMSFLVECSFYSI